MSTPSRGSRRRGNARAAALRWAVGLALGVVLFGLGVAVGEALHDNPRPGGGPVTYVQTLTKP